jgi:hypothetical protein
MSPQNLWLRAGSMAGQYGNFSNFAVAISLDVRDSVPDRSAFTAKPAPAGARTCWSF